MKMAAYLSLCAGGPGSGCHGPNCGRPSSVVSMTKTAFVSDTPAGFKYGGPGGSVIAYFTPGRTFEKGVITLHDSFFDHNATERHEIIRHEQAHRIESVVPDRVKSALFDYPDFMATHGRNVNEKLAHWIADYKPLPDVVKEALPEAVLRWAGVNGFNTAGIKLTKEALVIEKSAPVTHGKYVMNDDGEWVLR